MKNKELLDQKKKLEKKESEKTLSKNNQNKLEMVRKKLQLQDSSSNNFVDFSENNFKKNEKIKGSKKRPESRERKVYKKLLKNMKEIPKSERHQKTKIIGRMKKNKKRLTKVIGKMKQEGYDY